MNSIIDEKDEDGNTPLIQAVFSNSFEIIKILLERGANPNIKNINKETALDISNFLVNIGLKYSTEAHKINEILKRYTLNEGAVGIKPPRTLFNGKEISCGVAIVRWKPNIRGHVPEILLAHPSGDYNINKGYGFPKGHMEEGESEIETAEREGAEETGNLNFKILPQHRFIQINSRKNVIIFIAKLTDNANLDDEGKVIKHDWENDTIKFFPIFYTEEGKVDMTRLPKIMGNQSKIMEEILNLDFRSIIS
jgi:predicted NUDIX family NTP pyrophosphohydrolase